MVITEIFKSIQGEGTRAGLPCIFVRLTGCNLRCTWGDTAYAFHGGGEMDIGADVARVGELPEGRGGRPGLRRAVVPGGLGGGGPVFLEGVDGVWADMRGRADVVGCA